MNFVAFHFLSLNGNMFYSKIFGEDEKSIKLINRGLLDKLQDLSRSDKLSRALDTQIIHDGNLIFKYRNLGEIIVIVTSDSEFPNKIIDELSWKLLRFIGNTQLSDLFEENFSFEKFELILNEISSNIINAGLKNHKKKLNSVSLIDLPIKYRNLALKILANPNLKIDLTQETAKKFNVSLDELQNGINYLKSEGYI